ncbi:hypothetical protein [Micromonospora cathayae]|uniref:Uncharacterized protein n=1 Tax=Micromonospora cathayae TaxID=3028804 RepID=A0ABY7ZHU9_9ACTN|nr:hypothetical protein [Micromonospora sp. HUAS 3]WDZ82455.1 hypothetical protein PVK37_18400 [Micromonospora sp. HUAS 3]
MTARLEPTTVAGVPPGFRVGRTPLGWHRHVTGPAVTVDDGRTPSPVPQFPRHAGRPRPYRTTVT